MAIVTCERRGEQVARAERCTYCNKQVCEACLKSSKRIAKTRRYFICKSCWGNIGFRTRFKSS